METNIPEPKKESLRQEVMGQTLTLFMGGLSLVAALAWNDAVSSLFNHFFPKNGGLIAKFLYAALVTVVIVFMTMRLRKLQSK